MNLCSAASARKRGGSLHLKGGDDLADAVGLQCNCYGLADEFGRRDRAGEGDPACGSSHRDAEGRKIGIGCQFGLDCRRRAGIKGGVGRGFTDVARLAPHDAAFLGEFLLDILGAQLQGFQPGGQRLFRLLALSLKTS